MKISNKILFSFLLTFGILGIFLAKSLHQESLTYQKYLSKIIDKSISVEAEEIKKGINPIQLTIDSFNISLPVISSSISEGVWEVNDEVANHLSSSAKIGEDSNIVIYGHNKWAVLGKIKNIKAGDVITLVGQNALVYQYQVFETLTVTPEEIEHVLPTDTEQLTIYTCSGFADTKRFIIKAKLIDQAN